jgi:xanthine dehydrogenase YagR molybdenum-binding subunit
MALRLLNYAEVDPESGKPFSSKALRECYRFRGRKIRLEEPQGRTTLDAGWRLVGWLGDGLERMGCDADARQRTRHRFRADGTAGVTSGTSDIGPGTYTVMTMIAAEFLGLRLDQVAF